MIPAVALQTTVYVTCVFMLHVRLCHVCGCVGVWVCGCVSVGVWVCVCGGVGVCG